MTSVVPERDLARPELRLAAPATWSGLEVASDTRWLRRLGRRLFLLDAVLVTIAVASTLLIRYNLLDRNLIIGNGTLSQFLGQLPFFSDVSVGPRRLSVYVLVGPLLAMAWTVLLVFTRAYDGKVLGVGGDEYRRVARASVYFWGLVAIASYMAKFELSRFVLAMSFLLGTFMLLAGRWGARKLLHRARRRSTRWSHRVLVVGGRDEVNALVAELEREPYAGLKVVGACMPPGDAAEGSSVPVVGSLTSVPEAVAKMGIDTVAVTASRGLTSGVLKRLGWDLEGAGVDLVVAPALTDVAGPRVHVRPVSGLQLLYVEQPEFTGPTWAMKEAFDRALAAVALLALSPLLALIALTVRLTSSGPVIFRQVRVGRNGEVFTVYKFRTMVVDAERHLQALWERSEGNEVLFKMKSDPRVTKVGRLLRRVSLDELPQLANVLLGSMSLVGPRPALPNEAERYGRSTARRLLVKPGITGLWQVSGRSDLSWEDSVRLDLYYVENWSFAGDIQILWKTLSAVVRGHGAY
jgi:exopolysaccharide biosynthesis polyprenyl glycosylphosphotransferase